MSNVNTYVVAFSRLRCRKNRRENRRQINRTTTVANVTEALKIVVQEYHRKIVLAPADNAANNVVVVWKIYYINILKQELSYDNLLDESLSLIGTAAI